ncbi:MAG: hypothetical protein R3C19_00645 [Planctomycetaceae bacterium]
MKCVMQLILGATLGLSGGSLVSGDQRVMREVFDAWNQRQQIANRVYYELDCRTVIPKGAYSEAMGLDPETDPDPVEDTVLKFTRRLYLDFDNGKSRSEKEGDDLIEGMRRTACEIALCDGEHIQAYQPREKYENPAAPGIPAVELMNHTPDGQFRAFFFDPVLYPIFCAHGIVQDDKHQIAPLPSLRHAIQESYFHYDRAVSVNGQELVVVRSVDHPSQLTSEYWVDMARDAAIVRMLHLDSSGDIYKEVDIDYEDSDRGWFPSGWTDSRGAQGSVETVKVANLEFNPDFSGIEFHIEPTPGMIYRNEGSPEAMVAAATGSPDMRFEYSEVLNQQRRTRQFWMVLVGVGAAAFVGLLYWRRSRN